MSYLTGADSAANRTVKALLAKAGIIDELTVRSRAAHITVQGWTDPTVTVVSGFGSGQRIAITAALAALSGGTAWCIGGRYNGERFVTVYWGGEEN